MDIIGERSHGHRTHYLGDGDPNIQALLLGPHHYIEEQEPGGIISLNIPELDSLKDTEEAEKDISSLTREAENTQRTNFSENFLDESSAHKNITLDNLAETSEPQVTEENGVSYVTSRHHLRDKISSGKGYYRAKYFVQSPASSTPKHREAQEGGRCTNVTAVLNKPVTSPSQIERHVGYADRQLNKPTYSANSIRTAARDKEAIKMSVIGSNVYSSTHQYSSNTMTSSNSVHLNRIHEKEELQRLNDRFSAYIMRVRELREQGGQFNSASFLKSAKMLEDEVSNLKVLYENELQNLRCQLDEVTREKNNYHMQCSKTTTTANDLQDRLSVEVDKNRKLMDELNISQQRISNLETELAEATLESGKPLDEMQQLQREMDNLKRENEHLKHRLEKEQLFRQESDDRYNQLVKKMEFDARVYSQETNELKERLHSSTATIISMENRISELSKTDNSVPDLLRQVREAAEAELKQYKAESENQYSRNIASLKTQIDSDAKSIERIYAEKTELLGSIGELKARITSLEGQIQMLQHQKQSVEGMLAQERSRSVEQFRLMEAKVREIQDQLVIKMQEANSARDASLPLKAEIEAMKMLLEEEERRLNSSVGISSCVKRQNTTCIPRSTAAISASEHTREVDQSYSCTQATPSAPPLIPQESRPPPPTINTFMTMSEPQSYPPLSSSNIPTDTYMGYQANTSLEYPTSIGFDYPAVSACYPPASSQHVDTLELDPVVQSTLDQVEYEQKIREAGLSDYPITGTRYTYESSPGVSKLQIEPSPPLTPRPVGPVIRASSAPASKIGRGSPLVSTNLGQGKDYFEAMFNDLRRVETLHSPKVSLQSGNRNCKTDRSTPAEFPSISSSAIGNLRILDVNKNCVKLENNGEQEVEFGGYIIQQNVGGHPVGVFRFPPRTKFPAQSVVTVWSGGNSENASHNPPSDFVWKEQVSWRSGPECTTMLCKPNGQAIAWTTPTHRLTNDEEDRSLSRSDIQEMNEDSSRKYKENIGIANGTGVCLEKSESFNQSKEEVTYLKREKRNPPSLTPQRHPHGMSPGRESHPHTAPPRAHTFGNDNSTVNRQSRSQTTRPDPVPGQPYTSAAAQKVGSAPLRKFSPTQNKRTNTTLSKQSAGSIRYGPPSPFISSLQQDFNQATNSRSTSIENERASTPPNPFMTPHTRFERGLKQIQSQHNTDFLPPMPRPPLFSSW